MHEVIIIGLGPAGMAAAVYAARKRMDTVLVGPDIGGQTAWSTSIENYLGFRMINGFDLAVKFEEHVKSYDVPLMDDRVIKLECKGDAFLCTLENGTTLESKSVIVASGRSARNLGVPGEEEFKGRGVAYCATCDAPLFAGENVAVVGGGNAGLMAAIELGRIAKHVTLIEEMPRLTGDPHSQSILQNAPNTDILTSTEVLEIHGTRMVDGMTVRDMATHEEKALDVAGIFVEIGSMPNTGFLPSNVRLTEKKEIEIDCANRTSVPGIFAAGDCTNIPHKQIIIAAGEGAKALLTASEYLVGKYHG